MLLDERAKVYVATYLTDFGVHVRVFRSKESMMELARVMIEEAGSDAELVELHTVTLED